MKLNYGTSKWPAGRTGNNCNIPTYNCGSAVDNDKIAPSCVIQNLINKKLYTLINPHPLFVPLA